MGVAEMSAWKRSSMFTVALFLLSLLGCNALFSKHRWTEVPPGLPSKLCTTLPLAVLSVEELSEKLADNFKQADEQIKQVLLESGNPGGAVLSFAYKDALIWTGHYGVKDMNGEFCQTVRQVASYSWSVSNVLSKLFSGRMLSCLATDLWLLCRSPW